MCNYANNKMSSEKRKLKIINFQVMGIKVTLKYIAIGISTVKGQRTKHIIEMREIRWSICAFAMCLGCNFSTTIDAR